MNKRNFVLPLVAILAVVLMVVGCSSKGGGSALATDVRIPDGTPVLYESGVRYEEEDVIGRTEGDIEIWLPSGILIGEGDLFEIDNVPYYGIAVEDITSIPEARDCFPEGINADSDGVVWLLADSVEIL